MESSRRIIISSLVAISFWVFVCPWVIADASSAPASWSFYIAGAIALVVGIVALMRTDDLPEYGLVAIAGWLVISPWMLDLSLTVTRQAIFYGVIIGGLAWLGRPSNKPKGAAA
jgi:sugar phosphate permease